MYLIDKTIIEEGARQGESAFNVRLFDASGRVLGEFHNGSGHCSTSNGKPDYKGYFLHVRSVKGATVLCALADEG
jgi:hypothetical protein